MLDRFVLNRSIASKTLILVAYRTESEKVVSIFSRDVSSIHVCISKKAWFEYLDNSQKVYDVGTVAMIEQVSCFTSSTFTQYTLHIVGENTNSIQFFESAINRLSGARGELLKLLNISREIEMFRWTFFFQEFPALKSSITLSLWAEWSRFTAVVRYFLHSHRCQ